MTPSGFLMLILIYFERHCRSLPMRRVRNKQRAGRNVAKAAA